MPTQQTSSTDCAERTYGGRLGAVGLLVCIIIPCFLYVFPHYSEAMQFDRQAIKSGAWWRLLSAQCTHWTIDHLFWNCSTTFLLWQLCERKRLLALFLIWISIPLFVHCFMPQFDYYRGLSGFSSALLAIVLVQTHAKSILPIKILCSVIGLGFIAKLLYESYFQAAFFAGASDLFVPTPLTHIIGFLGGCLLCIFDARQFAEQEKTELLNKQASA